MLEKRIWLLILSLAMCFLVGFSYEDKKVKATWIWQAELIIAEKEHILSFSKENGINLIYLRIDLELPHEHYSQFIKDATAAGIEVHAVGGHPAWATNAHLPRIMKLVNWVKQYNLAVMQDEQIKGIHLDIEPYLLAQWEDDKTSVLKEWKNNIEAFVEETKKGTDLEASADLAFWLDNMPTPDQPDTPFSQWMISQLDHTTLMTYRDAAEGPNGILALAENELNQADALGKKLVIAVNMKDTGEDHVSFALKGSEEMNRQLSIVQDHLEVRPSYAGNAIHDYRYWKKQVVEAPVEPAPAQPAPVEPVPDQPSPTYKRGTYIWYAELVMSEKDEILSFAKENGVNLLYTRLDLDQPFSAYRDFVREANEAGIEVHAMGGHPSWALQENQRRILRLVNWVKRYNQNATAEEQFRGIHLDIEPYVMPIWRENKELVLQQWMENIELFVQETKKDSRLEASVDFAMWFDNTPTPGHPDTPFNKWMISKLDHTTIMGFRDHLEGNGGIVNMVKNEVAYAEELGKKIIIAVEMKESHEGEFITYHEEGKAEMNRHLEQLPEYFGEYSSYHGHAVHAYDYWKYGKE